MTAENLTMIDGKGQHVMWSLFMINGKDRDRVLKNFLMIEERIFLILPCIL